MVMWLCLNKGFLSIVKKGDCFVVRSRVKDHITSYFPMNEIHENVGTDYKFRTFITKKELENFLMILPTEISYDNFKSSVEDDMLKTFYGNIWSFGYVYLGEKS